jgi:HD-GYP domain-containing protein (c-di-GMP phosphodiesterase class II)
MVREKYRVDKDFLYIEGFVGLDQRVAQDTRQVVEYGFVSQALQNGTLIEVRLDETPMLKRDQRGYHSDSLIAPLESSMGVIAVTNKKEGTRFDQYDRDWLSAFAVIASGYLSMAKQRQDALRNLFETIDLRDHYTGGHSVRVAKYAKVLAEAMDGIAPIVAVMMDQSDGHDIGKLGIDDEILNKPCQLNDQEYGVMKQHPSKGAQLLHFYPEAQRFARYHHERWDGGGYPDGVAGEDIPVEARLLSVADVFDALTTERPYKKAMPMDKSLAIIRDGAGTQFWEPAALRFCELCAGEKRVTIETIMAEGRNADYAPK